MNTLLLITILTASPVLTIEGKVVKITDGDTIHVLDSNNVKHKIRLAGIDTPERKQAYGTKAKDALGKLIHEKIITVKYKKKDRYKRIIGHVLLDGKWINLKMVAVGWAWHYVKYSKNKKLAKAEKEARKKKLGLWAGSEKPVAPWEWRKLQKAKRKAKKAN